MKFSISTINNYGRIGLLSDIGRTAGVTFETPLLLVQTRDIYGHFILVLYGDLLVEIGTNLWSCHKGSVPHLTHQVLQLAFRDYLPLMLSVATTVTLHDQVKEFGHGIAEFAGLKENFTVCIVHDPATETAAGYHVLDSEPIWTPHGKKLIDAEEYMDVMEAFKPDLYVALSDSDTDATSSKKRLEKSLSRSANMFQTCLSRHTSSKALEKSGLLAAVGGGYDEGSRSRMACQAASYPVLGYVIEGLHKNGSQAETLKPEAVKSAVSISLEHLPSERLRLLSGAWHPSVLLTLISLGCDVFDSSLPYLSTQRQSALIFPFRENMTVVCASDESTSYEMSLSNLEFKEDFNPLLPNCKCLTCQQHSRAYIHHLISTKELLASVLLMIHNLHHYTEFFKTIRQAIKNDTFEELERIVALCQPDSRSNSS